MREKPMKSCLRFVGLTIMLKVKNLENLAGPELPNSLRNILRLANLIVELSRSSSLECQEFDKVYIMLVIDVMVF